MRLLHTSDWHLGHRLHDCARTREHERFLAWLLDVVVEQEVEGMLLAGDVFDTANPPARAVAQWYDFLGQLARRCPGFALVVVAGNHDSASRLEAPRPLAGPLGVHLVGSLARLPGGGLDVDRHLIPLRGRGGEEVLVVAIPYVRPIDLPRGADGLPDATAGMAALHAELFAAAAARRAGGVALVATGHLQLHGATLSEDSERRLLVVGGEEARPASLYPPEVDYVALGHLHRAQTVGGEDRLRYAGAPLPMALGERGYRHQVLLVDVGPGGLAGVEAVAVPCLREILRLPEAGAGDLDAALAAVRALPARDPEQDEDDVPLLEVRVRSAGPRAELRAAIQAALDGEDGDRPRAARLVKISVEDDGSRASLADLEGRARARRAQARGGVPQPAPAAPRRPRARRGPAAGVPGARARGPGRRGVRILAIRGRNLASLAGDFAVELDGPVLGGAGLIAITGPTGAGKSTLLDALCLALSAAPRGWPRPRGASGSRSGAAAGRRRRRRPPRPAAAADQGQRGGLRRGRLRRPGRAPLPRALGPAPRARAPAAACSRPAATSSCSTRGPGSSSTAGGARRSSGRSRSGSGSTSTSSGARCCLPRTSSPSS
ncbi:MAG: exonuclease subunit SbcD [Planctomycetota bacterium]